MSNGELEGPIGGGDFDSGIGYESESAQQQAGEPVRLGGAWRQLQRALLVTLPNASIYVSESASRIARGR